MSSELGDGDVSLESVVGSSATKFLSTLESKFESLNVPHGPILSDANALKLSALFAFARFVANKLPGDSATRLLNIKPIVDVADAISTFAVYVSSGPDVPTRAHKDHDLEQVKSLVAARAAVKHVVDAYEVVGTLPGFISAAAVEMDDVINATAEHYQTLGTAVLAARTKTLAPLIKVQPFTDKSAIHWLDEFDGDAADSDELVGFCTDNSFLYKSSGVP